MMLGMSAHRDTCTCIMGKLVVLAKICKKLHRHQTRYSTVCRLPAVLGVRAEAFCALCVTGKCWVLPDHTYTRTHPRETSCLLACSLGNDDDPPERDGHVVTPRRGPRNGSRRFQFRENRRGSSEESLDSPRRARRAGRRPDCPAMLATATTPPGFPLVWSGVPTATYTMVGYDAGTLDIQVNAMQRLSTENSPEH